MNNKGYPGIWKANLSVNSDRLLEELLSSELPQFRTVYGKNEHWKGIDLLTNEQDLTKEMPYLRGILHEIGLESVVGVTIFNLEGHADLHRHRDMNGNIIFDILRIHIPIKTNSKALMEVNKKWYHLAKDVAWILDTSAPHALKNNSKENRIHLVVDIKKSTETNRFFPKKNIYYYWHIWNFYLIMSGLVLKDMVLNPTSLLKRLNRVKVLIRKK